MFHCNGWCFPWTIAMLGGVHVCLRRVDATLILESMVHHQVTHYCAAPIVHNLLIAAPASLRAMVKHQIKGMVAGAAPPASMIEGMAQMGFDITHVYGLTEVYGPASVAVKRTAWQSETLSEQVRLNGRQGVRYPLQERMAVLDPQNMSPIAPDSTTMGEIMFQGNLVMKGYLKNPVATNKAFEGGGFTLAIWQ
jgi:fatty-acyl-CoA synthase